MGMIVRRDFSGGWYPAYETLNAPDDVLLRADNLVWDQRGAVSLRPGSVKINGSPYSDTDIHSLFTAYLSGTRYRFAGATSRVYRNDNALSPDTVFAGSGDIYFGSGRGQVFMARSTTKRKMDASTLRTWGITAPTTAATVSAVAASTATVATFDELDEDAVAFWRLEETSGTRKDEVGSSDLTDNNTVTSATGKVGTAAQFTSANSEYLSIADNAALSTGDIDFTIAGWFYLDTNAADHAIVTKFAGAGNREYQVYFETANKRLIFDVSNDGTATAQVATANNTVTSTATWYHFVAYHDSSGNNIHIQLNNGSVSTTAHATGVFNGTAAFEIGRRAAGDLHMNGRIDAVGFWKRLLTTAEKTALYNGGSGREIKGAGFTASEGTITASSPTGEDSTAAGALELTPASSTGRGTVTKTFTWDQDLSTISSVAESPLDLFEISVRLAEPEKVERITVTFGLGTDSTDYFRTDRFEFDFNLGGTRQSTVNLVGEASVEAAIIEVKRKANTAKPKPDEPEPSVADKQQRERVIERIQERREEIVRERRPKAASGWTKLTCLRSQFNRIGGTSGRNWSTVRGFQVTYKATSGATGTIQFDTARIIGQAEDGSRIGTYKVRHAWVYSSGTIYGDERSGPSSESSEIILHGDKLKASIAAPGGNWNTLDSQINKVAVYVIGGVLDQYYEYGTLTTVPVGTGALEITIQDTDVDLLIANNPLRLDNSPPPDNIIGIEGPYADRMWALDSTGLVHYTIRSQYGSFMTSHAIRVGDTAETPYWIKQTTGGIYVGTAKDIYRISGDGAELPDGTVDFVREKLNVASPPVDAAVTAQGNLICYRAGEGWMLFDGTTVVPVPREQVDPLYKGYTQHGVSALNLSGGRFRVAMGKGQLAFIAPEGASTTTSQVLHRYDFAQRKWLRHTYTPSFRSILYEPDGTLITGDNAGTLRTMDTGTDDDSGTAIPVVLWTPSYHGGTPYNKKEPTDILTWLITAGGTATVTYHLDGSSSSTGSYTITATTNRAMHKQILQTPSSPLAFNTWQNRITGSFTTFILSSFVLNYTTRPQRRALLDTGWFSSQTKDMAWLRELRIFMTATEAVSLYLYLDGNPTPVINGQSISVTASRPKLYTVPFGRERAGGTYRVILGTATSGGSGDIGFECYWIEPRFDDSGNATEKKQGRIYQEEIPA